MASDGTIAFDSRIDTDNLEKDLSKMEEFISDAASTAEKEVEQSFNSVKSQVAKLAATYKDAGMTASDAMKKAWAEVKGSSTSFQAAEKNVSDFADKAETELQNVGEIATQSFDEIPQSVEKNLEVAETSVDQFTGKLQKALAAAGLAYGAKEITEVGISYEKAMNQVAMSTGAAGQELENLQGIASNVYADNFGESMEDAAESVAEVYKRTGLVGEKLQKATEDAYTLKNAFGYDVNESLQAATQLMNTFGITAEEAYTLITQGAQKGLDQNGDMLDTLNEYSVQFANLGYSAEDMFNMLANGVQNGTWSVDKLGDAVKEMNIRLNDGTADEALQALGLGFAETATDAEALKQAALDVSKAEVDLQKAQKSVNDTLAESGSASTEYQDALNKAEQAQINLEKAQATYNSTASATSYNLDEIKEKLANGGTEAQEAINDIMAALSQVENEQDRYVLGQTLMGTQWEDVGESAVQALMNTQGEISTTSDAMDKLADTQFDDLGSQLEKLKRKVETEVIVPVVQKYMPKIEKAIDYTSEHLDEIIEHAKPIAAAIATAFAIKKVVDFGNSTVTTVKTIKNAFKVLNTSNPLGWIAIGVSALVGLETTLRRVSSKHQEYLQGITDKAAEIPDELQKSIDATNDFAESWKSMKENMNSSMSEEFFNYESITKLKDSLSELINADGTIKAGAEEKVSDIIDQLNQYGDTGLTVSDGVIQKNGEVCTSYDQISDSIDKIIEKQHAQNLLNAAEQGYQEAINNRQQLLDNETEYAKALEDTQQKAASVQKTLDEIYKAHSLGTDKDGSVIVDASVAKSVEELRAQLDGYNKKIDETAEARAKNNTELEQTLAYISRYKSAQDDLLNGDFEGVGEKMAKLSSDFVTAFTGTREELKQQVSDFKDQYETLLETQKKSPELVSDEQLQNAMYLWNQSIVELEASTGEHATKIGTNFIDTLAAAGMSQSDQITALNTYIQNRLNDGESLEEIARSLGVNFTSKMAEGAKEGGTALEETEKAVINDALVNVGNSAYSDFRDTGYNLGLGLADGVDAAATAIASSTINAVMAALAAAQEAADIRSPSRLMRDKVGYMLGMGEAVGIEKSTPEVEKAAQSQVLSGINAAAEAVPTVGFTAEIAQTMVPETLGIMSNQGSSAVSAYNPIFQQAYKEPVSTPTAAKQTQTNQNLRDIIIPVSIGDETLDTIIVNAITRANASSGGWSV